MKKKTHSKLKLASLFLVFMTGGGCHSYNVIHQSEVESFLASSSARSVQVFDHNCSEITGENWKIADGVLTLDGYDIASTDILLVRERSKVKRPWTKAALSALPLAASMGAISRVEGVVSLAGGFLFGLVLWGLPAYVIVRVPTFHIATWVREEGARTKTVDRSEFPCR